MVTKFSNNFLIGVIGLMALILVACIFYIVQDNINARTRYSVKTFTPQGEVPQWVDFSITFSEAIVDKSRVGTEVPAEAFRFTPAVQGTARWIARDRIGFYLDAPLAPAAQYTVQLTPDLNPSETFSLTGQKEFKFATEPFAVEQTRMEFTTNEAREQATGFGTIAFNYPVTTADLKAHLSIELDDGTEVPYQIETGTATARTVRFETKRIKRGNADREIKVKIEKGFKCIGGQIGLEKAHITPVILRGIGTLGVTYSDVWESDGTPYISVSFSAPVLSDTIEPYLELTPRGRLSRHSRLSKHRDPRQFQAPHYLYTQNSARLDSTERCRFETRLSHETQDSRYPSPTPISRRRIFPRKKRTVELRACNN